MLMTDEMADAFGRPAFGFYANVKKFFTRYENVQDFAKALGADYSEVILSLEPVRNPCLFLGGKDVE